MTIDKLIKDEKLQCIRINRDAKKISALLGKTEKYEYLTREKKS